MKRSSSYLSLALVLSVSLFVSVFWIFMPGSDAQQASQPSFQTLPPQSLDKPFVSLVGEPIQPIPLTVNLNNDKVQLGRKLFSDPRLSRDDTIACVTCHDLENSGTDHLKRPVGIGGAEGDVNTLTVFNSANNFALFWDGRASTLENQVDGPLKNPKEMGFSWEGLIDKLKKEPDYVAAFANVYAQGINTETIKDAIATFERSLITPNSRFDHYLRGDASAITDSEKRGYQLFKTYGCIACHQGVNVGGNMFQIFGVMADYFADRGNITTADLGRFNVTGNESDRHRFRVPSLRNIAKTAPYFHDGSAATLYQAVTVMAKYQLGRAISSDDLNLIVQFLNTLTGEYNGKSL